MKKNEQEAIKFTYKAIVYDAIVYKYRPTAMILPDRTVLITNTVVLTNGPRRSPKDQKHVRQILNQNGDPVPPSVLYKPGNWDNGPLEIHLPIVFATYDPSQF
ncbi:hypothetical protein D4S03_09745 [bacterium]|nr:MAG: hypothetical protein D4S03_09745 [bacterium]